MRTTLDLDDDILEAARELARARRVSVGTAVSELARAGLAPRPVREDDGLPVFDIPHGAPILTPEMVRRALDDE